MPNDNFAVIEGYSSTKTFVQGSQHNMRMRSWHKSSPSGRLFGWEHIARYSDLSRKTNFYRAFDRPKYSEKTDWKVGRVHTKHRLFGELVLVEK